MTDDPDAQMAELEAEPGLDLSGDEALGASPPSEAADPGVEPRRPGAKQYYHKRSIDTATPAGKIMVHPRQKMRSAPHWRRAIRGCSRWPPSSVLARARCSGSRPAWRPQLDDGDRPRLWSPGSLPVGLEGVRLRYCPVIGRACRVAGVRRSRERPSRKIHAPLLHFGPGLASTPMVRHVGFGGAVTSSLASLDVR